MTRLSVVSGCYNEEANILEFCNRVRAVVETELPDVEMELIVIDNASVDRTALILREIAAADKRVKVILNNRNFGHIRSAYHALLQANGDAIVLLASDLEDPPELIPEFWRHWRAGYKLVLAQKTGSEESSLFYFIRNVYYSLINRLSDIPLIKNVTGFGLYDKRVIDDIRKIDDPYPYFRGLICDLGYARYLVPFHKPVRKRGISKNNFYTLYDMAMLGITNHSKVPLRVATLSGFVLSALSFLIAVFYLVYKLVFWQSFQVGTAPVVIGLFFVGAVQLFFIGILGEYIGSIHTQVLKRPPVFEKERINFDSIEGAGRNEGRVATSDSVNGR